MSELLRTLAGRAGIDVTKAENGVGAVITFLKGHLPEGTFEKVTGNIPGAAAMMDSFATKEGEAPAGGGGLLEKAAGLAGKLFGGGGATEGAADLAGMLGKAGFSLPEIGGFLPKLIELLQANLPPDVFAKVKEMVLPGGAKDAETA